MTNSDIKQKIKVLHLAEDLKMGGYERVILDIAEHLDPTMFDVHAWAISRGGPTADILSSKHKNIRVLGINSYHNPVNIFRLRKEISHLNPDIIHTHTYFSNTIGRLAAIFPKHAKIITHVHNTYMEYCRRHIYIERILSCFSDKIICCSNAVKDFVVHTEKISPEKVIVIYNGVPEPTRTNPEKLYTLKRSLGINETARVVVCVAKLMAQKGHRFLIQAIPDVVKKFKNIKFLIVGEGALRPSLEKEVDRLNVRPFVDFLGRRSDVPDLLQISDIFLQPSIYEGLSIATIEAMSYGLPVIASNVGGIREIVDNGRNGILIPSRDSQRLTEAIVNLLNNPSETQRFREPAKETAIRFSLTNMIRSIEQVYYEGMR